MAFDRSAIKDRYLTVVVNGQYKPVAVANLSDAQIVSALRNGRNGGALAAGWTINGSGQVVRASAAPAAPAPAAPAPSTPAPAAPKPSTDPALTRPPVGIPSATPTTGYLKVRQKQADKSWKVVLVHRSKLTQAQINAAMKNGLNGPVNDHGPAPTDGTKQTAGGSATGGGAATDAGSGAAAGGGDAAAGANPAAATGTIASWIPPQIGLGGLNADPATGRLDWSKIIAAANEISAVDPLYAQDISDNIFQAMQSVAPLQAEIQSLTQINPTTGKTLYQQLFDSAQRQYKSNASRSFGTAAARGIGSSGMLNSNLANNTTDFNNATQQANAQYGNQRITDLLRGMTDQLQAQDTNFTSSYMGALSRAYGGIPQIPGVSG